VEKRVAASQATYDNVIPRMPLTCWITKYTNTHTRSECVILTAFLQQQWLGGERLSCRRQDDVRLYGCHYFARKAVQSVQFLFELFHSCSSELQASVTNPHSKTSGEVWGGGRWQCSSAEPSFMQFSIRRRCNLVVVWLWSVTLKTSGCWGINTNIVM
jgi:hypothetical protein